MSHQVLARKWRPQTFADIVGQDHVVTALVNALKANRLHHAYLFSGTRGVGKTTVARVLAKALTCEQGITSEPCGNCDACQSITEGRFVDLIEVDAASRTRVEDTRELLENVQYAPTRGRFKIYLIDEVHMLSGHSFNALLKTLEEPPEHVKFLLATTDPQKLPVTVLSRCLQFTLRHISTEKIAEQLAKVLALEEIKYETPALIQLAESADGSMRDALSLLDQAIAYSGADVSEQTVSQMLGTVPSEQVNALIDAICDFDPAKSIELIHSLTTLNVDFTKLLDQMIMIFHASAISQAVPEHKEQIALFGDTIKMVSGKLTAEDIQLFYQIVLNSRKDLYLAHSPRAGFEMAVLRMIMFRPGGESKVPHAKRISTVPSGKATAMVGAIPENNPSSKAAPPSSRQQVETPKSIDIQSASEQGSVKVAQPAVRPVTADPADWLEIIEKAEFAGVVRALATHCALQSYQGNDMKLLLASEHESLMAGATVSKLTQKLKETFGENTKVLIEVIADSIDSPAQHTRDREAERLSKAEVGLEQDEFIKALKRDMQAEIVPGSLQPKQEGK
ncbi:MAG: DNA polymerase III subunit gamma/tau [Gammaproteobacteria bacterium]|nr:DNA polymerase III subunit gamma/tau [Gammaproteobacteria bacterium]